MRAEQVDVLILAVECVQAHAFALAMNQVDRNMLVEDTNIVAFQHMRLQGLLQGLAGGVGRVHDPRRLCPPSRVR